MASKLISHIAGLVSLKKYLTKRLLQAILIPNINMNSDSNKLMCNSIYCSGNITKILQNVEKLWQTNIHLKQ